ncbi:MAG: birA [Gammaproteobacteria bacterium]|jgi:BirA family biotin operon repressor/biotin-[acetyl-CoA-carboxylase] ligase|nr:birA [Gammaproteobacteria bacterium]
MKLLNSNLVMIAELLSDGQYHDGTSIGKCLNITRAAIWKAIKKLEEYDVPLNSIKGKGYRLEVPLLLLNQKKIKANLKHRSVQLDILEKTTSTNDYLKKFTGQNQKIIICMAETQTQGKGRLHRNWYSPFGENIYFSILCPFEKDISELSGLSLVVGLAVCHAIESAIELSSNCLKLKWPNDILLNHRKIAGILIEIEAESNGFCQAIIGIGINVNMNKAPKNCIDQKWSSLLKATKNFQDRNILGATLIDSLIDYLERFSSNHLSVFIEEWKKRDCLANREISLISGSKEAKGICAGINENGCLLLKTADKKILTFSSGDTTLLK